MFDMDGTLIDTEALIVEHMMSTFEAASLTPPTTSQSRRVIGLSLPVAIATLLGTEVTPLAEKLAD